MAIVSELKKADVSQKLVVASLIIKVGQYIGESLGYKNQFNTLFDFASFASIILFGVSIVLWLNKSQKKLEKLDGISVRIEDIDLAARYGFGPVHLANLLRARTHAHGHAGGETLCDVMLRVYGNAAQDLHNLTTGSKDEVELAEYHVVDKFLANLIRVLPAGAVWLGVTKLQTADAWVKDSAEPSYFEFQELVEGRTKAHEISYFRLWCFDTEMRENEMVNILQAQKDAGVNTRTVVSAGVPDMSLIWVPRKGLKLNGSKKAVDLDALFPRLLSTGAYEPLCAIQFTARGGKELDSMKLFAPNAERFTQLRIQFKRSWDRGKAVLSAV